MGGGSEEHVRLVAAKIHSQVNTWLRFTAEPVMASYDDLLHLEELLDRLAVTRHELGPVHPLQVEEDEFEAPRSDQQVLRKHLASRFPMLGFYNVPAKVTEDLGFGGMHVGDGIDDLLDITNELEAVSWHLEKGRVGDACWNFGFSFDHHWRFHLRSLLWYLEQRRMDGHLP